MSSRGRSNFTAKVNKYRRPDSFDNGPSHGSSIGQNKNIRPGGGDELLDEDEEAQATSKRFADIEEINGRDEQFGFVHYAAGPTKTGWILNMKSVTTNIKKEICN